jgi:hypothetical protein
MDPVQAPAPQIDDATRPRRKQSVRFELLDDGCALYRPGSEEVYLLNLTASYVWTGCDGTHSVGDLVRDMAGSLGGDAPPRAALERDIRGAIGELAGADLLDLSDPPRQPHPQRDRT